jgi:type IV fimbrial biogenesis protein FimT
MTLIELMVTVAVMAILLGFGLPSLTRMVASTRMSNNTNEFIAGLKTARAEAVRRGQPISIRADGTGKGAYQNGWTVFLDTDTNGEDDGTPETVYVGESLGGNTVVQRVSRDPDNKYDVIEDNFVTFNRRGGNNGGAAFFRICTAGMANLPGRIVQMSAVGNVTLDSTTVVCP